MKKLIWILRLFLILVLGYSVISKLPLLAANDQSTLFMSFGKPAAIMLIIVEALVVIGFASTRTAGWSAFISLLLFSMFIGLICAELVSREPHPCGCFGTAGDQSFESIRRGLKRELVLNAFLFLSCLYLLWSWVTSTDATSKTSSDQSTVQAKISE